MAGDTEFIAEYDDAPDANPAPQPEDDKNDTSENNAEPSGELEDSGNDDYEPDVNKLAKEHGVSEEMLETAMNQGWRPESEWDGDPDKWVAPKEFVFRGELFDRIKRESKRGKQLESKIEELNEALKTLGEHNSKIAKVEREKALRELKQMRLEAYRDGDDDTVLDLDDKIAEAEKSTEDLEFTPKEENNNEGDTNTPNPEDAKAFQDWVEENDWYSSDIALRGAADAIGTEIAKEAQEEGMDLTIDELLSKVTDRMNSSGLLKQKRSNPMRNARGVEGDQRTSNARKGRKTKYTERDLSDDQLRIAKNFVASGALTMDEYIQQLAEVGEIG